MNIQPINFYTNQKPNFKASYPVVHWVAETNGSYAPAVINKELNKKLHGILVRILNHSSAMTKNCGEELQKLLRGYVGKFDSDYSSNPIVRSYYDKRDNSFLKPRPISYIISGDDVDIFEDFLAKDIGRSIGVDERRSAADRYARNGLGFVNNPKRRVKDLNSFTQVLHTKFETIRDKLGKVKGYRLVDIRFLPENNYQNPLEKYRRGLL